MCGILAILGSTDEDFKLRSKALALSRTLRHRGPDWNGIFMHTHDGFTDILAHERLAIVDLESGAQPLSNESKTIYLCVNGEIYNHGRIRDEFEGKYKFKTKSDCESIIPLYEQYGSELMNKLDGVFAFVLVDLKTNSYLAARDPIGVCSMYMGLHHNGATYFASEMKGLEGCTLIKEFPPGHFYSQDSGDFVRWYSPIWLDESYLPTNDVDYDLLRTKLEASVVKRLMADVPFGVLLSGGLDSSIIAAIASRLRHRAPQSTDYGYKSTDLLTFSIGLEGSPDLKWAKKVADFIGSRHHSFTFTIEEGIDALEDVIHHIESYDVTTVRASTPMFLMARRIKAMGIKVVLSGEGSDEIFGGYLYFHKAPSPVEFQKELVRKIRALSKYDCLRANKATAAWGVEVRVPFLDRHFLDVAMSVEPKSKMIDRNSGDKLRGIEKFILRKAFDIDNYLPDDVLWRQKEQFSDGVGYNWIDSLKSHSEKLISDRQFKMAPIIYPYNTPTTKEAYLYREIFDSIFKKESCAKTVPAGPSIACSSSAALEWDRNWSSLADPSGRAIRGVHNQAI